MKFVYILTTVLLLALSAQAQQYTPPPGVVVSHLPVKNGRYVGSPSICVLPNGDYLASHDEFGPKSSEFKSAVTRLFRSMDKGHTWEKASQLDGQFWSTLFVHQRNVYIIGTNKHHGNFIIRRSTDNGKTWSIPFDPDNGLLLEGEYHTAPVPVVVHNGRIWRALEYATSTTTRWGERYSAMVMSAPVGSDLLKRSNWTFSNRIARDPVWLGGNFQAWLEGNVVVGRDGNIMNLMRVNTSKPRKEVAALLTVSQDGKEISFNSDDFYEMPGAAKKFTVRYDAVSGKYLTLANITPSEYGELNPGSVRNHLALMSSDDLKSWRIDHLALSHPDVTGHGYQYVDWLLEGEDIIFLSRTASCEPSAKANNNHDANYLTFHRLDGFRRYL